MQYEPQPEAKLSRVFNRDLTHTQISVGLSGSNRMIASFLKQSCVKVLFGLRFI